MFTLVVFSTTTHVNVPSTHESVRLNDFEANEAPHKSKNNEESVPSRFKFAYNFSSVRLTNIKELYSHRHDKLFPK